MIAEGSEIHTCAFSTAFSTLALKGRPHCGGGSFTIVPQFVSARVVSTRKFEEAE
jgi:hypothetical protein